jgi:dienelactone hydrolase
VERFPAKVRIWAGTNDEAVPIKVVKSYCECLKNGNSNVSLRIVDGAMHSFCVGSSYSFVGDEVIRYFKGDN